MTVQEWTLSADALSEAETPRQRLLSRRSEMREISIFDIRVNAHFQRHVNQASLKRIMVDFHPAGIGQVLVNEISSDGTDGRRYECIDGQTRVEAKIRLLAQREGGADVPSGLSDTIRAEVFFGLSADECATLFALRNDQVTVPTAVKRRVKYTAKDPLTMTVIMALQDMGHVPYPSLLDDADAIETVSSQAIEEACAIERKGLRAGRVTLLREVLEIQHRTYLPSDEQPNISVLVPELMHVTADLLVKNRDRIDQSELVLALRDREDIERLVDDLEKKEVKGHAAFQAAVLFRYNARNKGKRARLS